MDRSSRTHSRSESKEYEEYSEEGSTNGETNENGKRRMSLVNVSCQLCKQRKVKCDRNLPSCGWCTRNNAQCEYKERKKPGLRAGYGRELEQRLEKLETVLQAHSQLLETLKSQTPSLITPSLSPPLPARNSGPSQYDIDMGVHKETVALSSPRNQFPAKLPSIAPLMNHNRDADRSDNALGLIAGLQHAIHEAWTQPSSQLSPNGHSRNPFDATFLSQNTRQVPILGASTQPRNGTAPSKTSLPAPEIVSRLLDVYSIHVNTYCPIFDTDALSKAIAVNYTSHEHDHILFHAIVASALRFDDGKRILPESWREHQRIALSKVLPLVAESPSLRTAQALFVLTIDAAATETEPMASTLFAMLGETTKHLQSNYRHGADAALPTERDNDERWRLLWAVHLLGKEAGAPAKGATANPDYFGIGRQISMTADIVEKNKKLGHFSGFVDYPRLFKHMQEMAYK